MKQLGLITILLICAAGSYGNFFDGDLNRDLKVDLSDLMVFADQWLEPSGCTGRKDCADMDGLGGVNFADLIVIAERWMMDTPTPIITEFCASNDSLLLDEDGQSSDWIEIYNPLSYAVDLTGWTLTDNKDKPTKWPFPEMTLDAGQFLVVFASDKDRDDPAGQLHTNFVLDPDGEYLALTMDDGGTVVQEFDDYPRQYRDISYGLSQQTDTVLEFGGLAYYKVPTAADPEDLLWTMLGHSQSPWRAGNLPLSFDLGTDVSSEMLNVNASLRICRIFNISSPEDIMRLILKINYDDGFTAYLNGHEVASRNAPIPLAYNSTATATHDAAVTEQINLSDYVSLLQSGTNFFAVQAMNITAEDSDFYVDFELQTTRLSPNKESMQGYFTASTPGVENGIAETEIGPVISHVSHTPQTPTDTDDLVVTATVTETAAAVNLSSVSLHYRVMYGPETTVLMTDDGTGSDVTANDNIFTAVIPASASSSREMVRYYITASDTQANTSRLPLYKSPQFSEQYRGTVIDGNTVDTQMELFWWFVEDPAWYTYNPAGFTKEYTGSSVFYKGRFYDNVPTRIRGASSVKSKFPKQSLKFEFHQENRFYYSPEMDKLDEINVNALSVDKGFIRNQLSMNVFRDSGSPYSTSDMWLCYQNGQFHSVVNFVEQVDKQYLKRNGLPVNGALYKIFNYLTNSIDRPAWSPGVNPDALDGVEKKTRKWEDNSDLQTLVDGILTPANRTQFLFDNINIPEVINVMCGNIINQCWDRFEKNYYMYRDTEGTGQWYILPWDQDLGWGYLRWQNENLSGTHSGMSHPLYGEQEHPSAYGAWHRLDEAVLADATLRQMYLRRLRTVLDEQLQSPATPAAERKIEAYINEIVAAIGTEVDADKDKWGVVFGGFRYFQAEMDMLINNYLIPKRNMLFVTHGPSGTGLLPEAQVGNPAIVFGDYQVNPDVDIISDPAISPQDCEYIELENPNSYAVDISGWKLSGGVEFTFKPGTVIAANNSLYVCPNVKAFLRRNESPTGGESLFVVGGYDGHLSNWGETINLLAADDSIIDTFSYAENPSDQQRYLRISEMMYHPSSPDGVTAFEDDDFEYIELTNVGTEPLALGGVRFTDGVSYSFPLASHSETLDLLGYTDVWKYDQTDTDLGASWRQAGYNDAGWPSGSGLLYVEPSGLPEPKNTLLTLGPRTFYFRTHFSFPSDPSDYASVELKLTTILDDGAVLYLNGQEVFRLGVSEGQTHSSLSSRVVGDAVVEGPFVIPSDNLLHGDNVLAVEVHQQSDSSSDVVWGCHLQAVVTTQAAGQELQPGQHLVICKNVEAFAERYNETGVLIAAGNYTGNLSNSGESIKLEDLTGSTIQSFSYKDGWYELTDGMGFSLSIVDAAATDPNLWDTKAGWRSSLYAGGTPGTAAETVLPAGSIVINELLAHSHSSAPDWLELYNTTAQDINIGGWFLTDNDSSDANIMKYRIPDGTVIEAGDYYVFVEDQTFGNPTAPGCNIPFGLSEAGETVYLYSGQNDQVTGYYQTQQKFDASETGVTFGRYEKAELSGGYDFVRQISQTQGAINSGPAIPDIVITEIHYNPATGTDYEFVELYNRSGSPVTLMSEVTTETSPGTFVTEILPWRLEGTGFEFPANTTIPVNTYILVAKKPAMYSSAPCTVFGPYDGKLDNGGEEIELQIPGDQEYGQNRYWIPIEKIDYDDESPWPTTPDGNGDSLQRQNKNTYGRDYSNWNAASPTPGG